MPSAAELAKDDPELQTPNIVAARVIQAPAGLTDSLKVVIPSVDELASTEIIRFWMPRGDEIPSVGDQGLVAFDEDKEPWLIAWTPAP